MESDSRNQAIEATIVEIAIGGIAKNTMSAAAAARRVDAGVPPTR